MPTGVIHVFFPQCLMDVAQNHEKWMCTAPKHDQICSSKACVANIPEVGIRNLSTFVVDVAAICQANRSKLMDAAKLEPEDHQAEFYFFEMFQSQFGVFIALCIIDLVLGSSRVSGSHCNATNSFDGGDWVFLGIHTWPYGVLKCHCTLIPYDSMLLQCLSVVARTLGISLCLSWCDEFIAVN